MQKIRMRLLLKDKNRLEDLWQISKNYKPGQIVQPFHFKDELIGSENERLLKRNSGF